MAFSLKPSAIDPSLCEIIDGTDVVKEIPVGFRIKKFPSRPFSSVEEVEAWLADEEMRRAKFFALKLLERKNQSASELEEKLVRKGISQPVARRIVEEMRRLGFVADGRLAESIVEKELKRGHGPRYIEMKLRSLGLDEGEARRQITDEMQREAIRKILPKLRNPAAALQRRGFDLDSIFSELRSVK